MKSKFFCILFVLTFLCCVGLIGVMFCYASDDIYEVSNICEVASHAATNGGATLEKQSVKISALCGKFGSYHAFDTFYDAVANGQADNSSDRVSDSASGVLAGGNIGLQTYIMRYMMSATAQSDAVIRFEALRDVRIIIEHPIQPFGVWATHARIYIIQESSAGVVTLLDSPVVNDYEANRYGGTFNLAEEDKLYLIFRMVGNSPMGANENYANIGYIPTFTMDTANYNVSARESLVFGEYSETRKMSDVTNISEVTSRAATNFGANTVLNTVEIAPLCGEFGNYRAFDYFFNAVASGNADNSEDMVLDTTSTAQTGESVYAQCFIKRYMMGATQGHDSALKFTARQNIQLSITHDGRSDSWATHAQFIIIQESEDGIATLLQKGVTATYDANAYGGIFNLKAGDSLYFILHMAAPTVVPGHDYASLIIIPTFSTSCENYDASARETMEFVGVETNGSYYYDVWSDNPDREELAMQGVDVEGDKCLIVFCDIGANALDMSKISDYGIIVSTASDVRKFKAENMRPDGKYGIALYGIPMGNYEVSSYVEYAGKIITGHTIIIELG